MTLAIGSKSSAQTFTISGNNTQWKLWLEVTALSQSITNNTTKVTYKLF